MFQVRKTFLNASAVQGTSNIIFFFYFLIIFYLCQINKIIYISYTMITDDIGEHRITAKIKRLVKESCSLSPYQFNEIYKRNHRQV